MGMWMPETCWAVFKWQVINLRICCIWLVDSVESMMDDARTGKPLNDDHAWTFISFRFISFHTGNWRSARTERRIDKSDACSRRLVNPLFSLKISHIATVPKCESGSSFHSWSTVDQTATGNYEPTMLLRYCCVVCRAICDVRYSVSLCVDCWHCELQARCEFYCISLRVFSTEQSLTL